MSTLFITRPDLPASQELLTAKRQGGRLVGTLKRGHSIVCTFVISPSQERSIARGERIAIRDTDVITLHGAGGTRVREAEQLSHAPRKTTPSQTKEPTVKTASKVLDGGSPIMLTHGLRVIGDGDEAYKVSDARRVLGHVVRFWIPGKGGGMRRQFRAFGENFDTLGDAVREFTKIRGVLLFDAKGDLPENSPSAAQAHFFGSDK